MNRLRAGALIASIVVLAAACGSTNTGNVSDASSDDDTTAASQAPGASTSAGPVVTDAAGRPAAGEGATVSGPGATALPGAVTTPAPGLERGTGTIRIGFHYSSDIQAAFRAFGASGEFVDDEKVIPQMVRWVNAHGGLGGKRVEAFVYGTNPLSGSFPQQAEEACTYFAEDAKVSYVVSGAILPDDNMPACFARRKVPLVWSYQYLTARATFDKYANTLYMPHNVGTDRMGFFIPALNAAKFFDANAKIGLVRYDNAAHEEFADKTVKPALAKLGRKVVVEAVLSQPHAAGEAGTTANQAASAILRMNNAGVTHLIWVPSGGAIPLVWSNQADTQNFHPRNAFTSLDIPIFLQDNMSTDQLSRALVVGWMPAGNDTPTRFAPKTPGLDDCKAAQGVATPDVRFCDGFFFLKAALDRTPRYGVDGLRKAVDTLGTGFHPVWPITTRFSAQRHDGATSYRMLTFNTSCTCFRLSSEAKPIP